MARSFRGGVHPDGHKADTAAKPLETLPPPEFIILPLSQHIGAPAVPLVEVGDSVLLGQKIAEAGGFVSAPVHATVSGIVLAIEPRVHPGGGMVNSIIIENNFRDDPDPSAKPRGTVMTLTPEEIVDIAREAGIVGLGGAAFPTHVKLKPSVKITDMIINCAECEPYITSGYRAMMENTAAIIGGVRLAMKAAGAPRAVIAFESNKYDAADAFEKILPPDGDITVKILKTKYPQGGEKQLVKAVTGRDVPSGELPSAVGCMVFNPETCLALYRAALDGAPLLTRGVTVSGSAVANPKNLLCRIGTPFLHLFEAAGGFLVEPSRIIAGGPMMGVAQSTLDAPVVKATNAVLAFAQGDGEFESGTDCIKCGKCVEVCPMKLVPAHISMFYKKGYIEDLERYNVGDCIECGACAYTCPARLPLAQTCRAAKTRYNEYIKEMKARE